MMKSKNFIVLSLLISLCCVVTTQAKELEVISPNNISPKGWLKTMLVNQRDGFTGVLDEIIYPFTQKGWGTDQPFLRNKRDSLSGFWVPFEQTAYYYDGVVRCGYLLKDEKFTKEATDRIYKAIDMASPEGIIEPRLAKMDRRRWPHALFFRAMMSEYEATKNEQILDAMTRHFLNDTIPLLGRDLCNMEPMTWLYQKTNNPKIRKMAIDLYNGEAMQTFKAEELGDYGSDKKQEVHGVTYNEMLKMPILYYMLTGDEKALDVARNGFAKLDKFNMLPDGVNSSEEGISGKGSRNTHESCDIVDYMWTCTYMLRATGETQWADRMERALFNAGMGSITKNFDAHQYNSAPNQVYCDDHSCHVLSYDASRMAFRQAHVPPCCTGNVNRMFPIYVGAQWLKGENNSLYKALYGPSAVTHKVGSREVVVEEESVYPYTDDVVLTIKSGSAKFPLNVRIPVWCSTPKVTVNGKVQSSVVSGEYYTISRDWRRGDKVVVSLPKKAEFINWDGYEAMVVNYGPILFSLPIKADIKQFSYTHTALGGMEYKGYTMTPLSSWNYILGSDGTNSDMIRVKRSEITMPENPWLQSPQPLELIVPMYQDPTWKEHYHKVIVDGKEQYEALTPPLPARGAMIFVLRHLKPEMKKLVPYGSTYLRMTMFPFWKAGKISPEILATEGDYK